MSNQAESPALKVAIGLGRIRHITTTMTAIGTNSPTQAQLADDAGTSPMIGTGGSGTRWVSNKDTLAAPN